MKASELINHLQSSIRINGDLKVVHMYCDGHKDHIDHVEPDYVDVDEIMVKPAYVDGDEEVIVIGD
jgi:hypothetical protein